MKQRDRLIRAAFWTSDELADCGLDAHHLLGAMFSISDREGRLKYRPRLIKIQCMPFYDVDIHQLIQRLLNGGHVQVYTIDGTTYLQINNFKKHNSFHWRETESVIPPPPEPVIELENGTTVEGLEAVQMRFQIATGGTCTG